MTGRQRAQATSQLVLHPGTVIVQPNPRRVGNLLWDDAKKKWAQTGTHWTPEPRSSRREPGEEG